MADKFSLDDILAEIDAKKSTGDHSASDKGAAEGGYSITSIIGGGDEIGRSKKTAKNPALDVSALSSQPKPEESASPLSLRSPEPIKEDKPSEKKSAGRENEQALKESSKSKEKPKSDFIASLAKKLTDASPREISEIKEPTKKEPSKSKEYNTEQRNFIKRQLEAEESLEDPDELIDAINPFDIMSKAQDKPVVGGDTLGIAGDDLKALAEVSAKASEKSKPKLVDKTVTIDPDGKLRDQSSAKTAENPVIRVGAKETPNAYSDLDGDDNMRIFSPGPTLETTAPVKKYIPQKEQEAKAGSTKLSEKEKRSNEALLTKLNSALSKKHEEQIRKRQTGGLSRESENTTGSLIMPTGALNLDGQKIIMATGVIPESEIKEKAKRKLRDFVMDSQEEEEEEEAFDSYDSSGQIWADLCESHKVIKIRLFLLLMVAVFMLFTALVGDIGKDMVFSFFGNDVLFLDKRADVQGFLFYSLIIGIITTILCASVISGGLVKAFKLKADCDSVCAVSMVVAIIATAINITDSYNVLMSYSYILIPTAVSGLMFNTLGKLMMIRRAKRSFRFISGDSKKYSLYTINSQSAYALTKGVVGEVPCLAAMRKTELLTDFLKSSYCEDRADRLSRKLVPAAFGSALLISFVAFFFPYSDEALQYNIYWTITVFTAVLTSASPFSMMFVINLPLSRAAAAMSKSESTILGYQAAEEFSSVNSVIIDASLLFPPGTVIYSNIKHCKPTNSLNNIALDQAIILAASLAIQSGSVMSNMFKNMINDKDDILVKVENCVYEDNLGVLGWYGTRRLIMGSREQMKRHDIKVPDMKKISKYTRDYTETIYLSVGGEVVIMFFVELLPNPEVKKSIKELSLNGTATVIKTTDSIITVSKISEVFEISPEKIKILPYSMHESFSQLTKYVSRSSGAVSCSGTFTGFAKALIASKKLMKDINLGYWIMLIGAILGIFCSAAITITGNTFLFSSGIITAWNIFWLILSSGAECFRKY